MSSVNHHLRYSLPLLSLLFLDFLTLDAENIFSFSLQGFDHDNIKDSNFNLTFLGDAHISNVGSFVNLTSPSSGSGAGQIVYQRPLKFVDPKSSNPLSFSAEFNFSISPGHELGLAFVIFPNGEVSNVFGEGPFGISNKFNDKFVAVEYDTRNDGNVGDLNGNRVGVDVGSFASAMESNVSSLGLRLDGDVPLKTWIDYEASSKRLEVRLAKSVDERPYEPLVSYPIDISKVWGVKEVMLAISSSNGNSTQVSSLFSWIFSTRTIPSSLHSQPLDPESPVTEDHTSLPPSKKKSCFLTVLGALIFATGCGTLVAFILLFLWVVVFGRQSTVTPEVPLTPMECRYEKVNVTVHNASESSTN